MRVCFDLDYTPDQRLDGFWLKVTVISMSFIVFLLLQGGFSFTSADARAPSSLEWKGRCAEDPIQPVEDWFAAVKHARKAPDFDRVFEISSSLWGKEKTGVIYAVWVTGGKLAYIYAYKGTSIAKDEYILYYDGKERHRSLRGSSSILAISPVENIQDRLTYSTKDRIVFGGFEFLFPPGFKMFSTASVAGKLFVRGLGGTFYDGKKMPDNVSTFAIGDHIAEKKSVAGKMAFIYKAKEYGKELDGLAGDEIALCNDRPVYVVGRWPLEKGTGITRHAVHEGQIIGRPYREIKKIGVVGGAIVFLAIKEWASSRQDSKTVLVKNGEEISGKYESVIDFFSHRGHLVYFGSNRANPADSTATHYVVQDNQVLYTTAPGEQVLRARGADVVSLGTKLAFLTYDKEGRQKKFMYNGIEIPQPDYYRIEKILDWNDRLVVWANDYDKRVIQVERRQKN